MRTSALIVFALVAIGCTSQKSAATGGEPATAQQPAPASSDGAAFTEPAFGTAVEPGSAVMPGADGLERALFAGGCFWCLEPPFDAVDGVVATVSGYAGGPEVNPQYKEVAGGRTGHTEVVLVVFDPDRVTYDKLLDVFWRTHDPTDAGGQFVDRGSQYRPAIFAYGSEQQERAQKSADALDASGRFDTEIVVEIAQAPAFWPAEAYHQDFYKKDPNHYKRYRSGSGRDQFLDRVWND